MAVIYNVLLLIDGAINDLTNSLYKLFLFFAKLNLFSDETYQDVVGRIYIILGMIMLFVLAYSLLRAVINPDDFSKGDTSFPNLIKNIVISIAIIAVLPSVFTLAFNIQNSILNQGTIPRLILGNNGDMGESSGVELTYYTYQVFFHVNEETCIEDSGRDSNGKINISGNELTAALAACGNDINTNNSNVKWYTPWRFLNKEQTFSNIDGSIKNGEISFTNYNQFGEAVAEKRISYYPVISLAASVFILWVLANFCFDMALRVIKLMFYQIIAPIPVVCRAIPIGGLKDVFNKWTKNTIHTFLEVFIRVAVMYIGIDMIRLVVSNNNGVDFASLPGILPLIARGLIIMGVVMFIRQAPKLLGDLFGIDSGGMKLGLMDKLAQGGVLTAASAVGGGLGTAVKNFARTEGKGFRGFAKRAASATGGLASGTLRGFNQGLKAKNWADVKKGASTAQVNAEKARLSRLERGQRYKAKGQDFVTGHITDMVNKSKEFLYGDVLEKMEKRVKTAQEFDIRDFSREWVISNDELTKNANQRYKDFEAKKMTKDQVIDQERKRLESLVEQGTARQADIQLLNMLNDTSDPLHNSAIDSVYNNYRKEWWTEREALRKEFENKRDAAIDRFAQIEGSEINRKIQEANLVYAVNSGDSLFAGTREIDINHAASSMKANHNRIVGHEENDFAMVRNAQGEYEFVYQRDAAGNIILDANGEPMKVSTRNEYGDFVHNPVHDITGNIEKFRGSQEYRTAMENKKAQEESKKNGS